ncbi:hypothetical protein DPMN_020131 [Dreissena polymorpha]|uniref:Uncharacterized protein n=1 Tax=Dreissena polymorpha TaxID=45954 RepID=A0A9D4NM51_DREPO|nr:hypothetical protein DPMN_020131 [Dreissena polymorpha]
MTSQHDIRDCRDEMTKEAKTQYENFQWLTCLKPGKQSNEYVPGAFAVTASEPAAVIVSRF